MTILKSVSAYSVRGRSTDVGNAGRDDQKMRSQDSIRINVRQPPVASNRVAECATALEDCQTASDTGIEMLWIFERQGEQMRCEIRRDGVGAGYEMIVTHPDGSQRMERFEGTGALIKRTLEFQRELMETGWRQPKN